MQKELVGIGADRASSARNSTLLRSDQRARLIRIRNAER